MDKQKPTGKPATKSAASSPPMAPPDGRRGFLTATLAIIIGGFVALFPFAAGLAVFFDPLSRPMTKARRVRVTTLDNVPDDGLPHDFSIITDSQDAWNHYPDRPIGRVWLIRQPGQKTVNAFNATCPHAGCSIGFIAANKCFLCPCHASSFDLAGKRRSEDEASPRDMDSLECTVTKTGNVMVKFENYHIATSEKRRKA